MTKHQAERYMVHWLMHDDRRCRALPLDNRLLAKYAMLLAACVVCATISLAFPLASMAEGTTEAWHVFIAFLVIPSVTGIHYGCIQILDYMHSLEDEE